MFCVSLHRHGVFGVPQRAKTNQLKKIIHALFQLVNFLFPSRASVEIIALMFVLLVSLLSRIHITTFHVIIVSYHRQFFSQLLFMMLTSYSSVLAPSIPRKRQTHQEVGCVRQRGRVRVTD